jgi:HD-GYP domain-containing protein (c-di-GMP phosphodiesterase class II)
MLKGYDNRQLQLFSVLISTKDFYTYRHQDHVSQIVGVFWDYLPQEIRKQTSKRRLVKLGQIHDIGKLFIDSEILNKSDKLNEDEWEIMRSHAAIGAGIIDKTSLKSLSNSVLLHHEWKNGNGYYKVLAEQIPIESRIISICDTLSALTNDRPYRKGKSVPEAMQIIKDGAGTQFDEVLVDWFLKIDTARLMAVDSILKKNVLHCA